MKKKVERKYCHVRIYCNLCVRIKDMTFCIARQDMKTTKETIPKGSIKLFLAKGYRGISMPDIERATKITCGDIFQSKVTSTIAIILCCLGLSLQAATAQEVTGRVVSKERTPLEKKKLLERFKADGFYLMDLYPMPLDKKPKGKGKSFFAEVFMRRFNNEQIAKSCIIVLLNPAKVLEYPLKSLGYKVFVLPFPLYGGKAEFVQQFREIMNNR